MTQLRDAVVLITGAAGGFGQELIRQFLAEDAQLIVSDLNQAVLESCAETLQREVGRGAVLRCIGADLSTAQGCQALVEAAGVVPDVLINNAGLALFGRFDEIPAPTWERLMAVNLMAPMRLISLFLPGMIARGSGHLVNISSMAGWIGSAGLAPYAASKHGLRGLGEALSEELSVYGIRVTTVFPFYSRTPILDSPRYGSLVAHSLPDSLTSLPADVIRAVLDGIRHEQSQVFPDPMARRLHLIKRFVPWLLPLLARQLETH
jgi:short-subunit dehydrogenase